MADAKEQIENVLKQSQGRELSGKEQSLLRKLFGKLFASYYSPGTGVRFTEAFQKADAFLQEADKR